jgi:hypothetical protein
MKILKRFWQALKGEDVKASEWIVHQAKWDAKRKLYIVGDLSVPSAPSLGLDHPSNRTVDQGDIPVGWHQCFYYEERKNPLPSGGSSWIRCRNLAGPGFKPSFCLLHSVQEAKLHEATERTKNIIDMPKPVSYKFCRHGRCIVQIVANMGDYCTDHKHLYEPNGVAPLPNKNELALYADEDACGCYGYCERHFNSGRPRTPEQIEFDAIKEEVDWDYCSKIGWGELRYRRNRKSIPVQAQETVHFKLELRGNRDEIDLFHAIIHLCDNDYPLDPFRKNTAHPEQCKNCGGYVWSNAIVTPVDIKKAAKQAGMNVKVRFYFPASTCKKKDRTAEATA